MLLLKTWQIHTNPRICVPLKSRPQILDSYNCCSTSPTSSWPPNSTWILLDPYENSPPNFKLLLAEQFDPNTTNHLETAHKFSGNQILVSSNPEILFAEANLTPTWAKFSRIRTGDIGIQWLGQDFISNVFISSWICQKRSNGEEVHLVPPQFWVPSVNQTWYWTIPYKWRF